MLGWTAASMVLHDLRLGPVLHNALPYAEVLLYALSVVVVFGNDLGIQIIFTHHLMRI